MYNHSTFNTFLFNPQVGVLNQYFSILLCSFSNDVETFSSVRHHVFHVRLSSPFLTGIPSILPSIMVSLYPCIVPRKQVSYSFSRFLHRNYLQYKSPIVYSTAQSPLRSTFCPRDFSTRFQAINVYSTLYCINSKTFRKM